MKPEASHAPLEGRTIADKFVIESLLGQGAMGAVYRARQVALEKTVAIKVLHRDLIEDPAVRRALPQGGEGRVAPRPSELGPGDRLRRGARRAALHRDGVSGRRISSAVMRANWPLPGERIIGILMQVLSALQSRTSLGLFTAI